MGVMTPKLWQQENTLSNFFHIVQVCRNLYADLGGYTLGMHFIQESQCTMDTVVLARQADPGLATPECFT